MLLESRKACLVEARALSTFSSLLEPQVLPDDVGENYTLRTRPNKNYLLLLLTLAYTSYQVDRYLFGHVGGLIQESVDITPYQYSILIGPVFALPNALSAVFVGFVADRYNKIKLMTLMLSYWSMMSAFHGFSTQYWQLIILRTLFSLSHCNIISVGLLSEYFDLSTRGKAIGILHFGTALSRTGVYLVGSLFLQVANYRWVLFWMSAPFGLFLILSVGGTIREYEEEDKQINQRIQDDVMFDLPEPPTPKHSRLASRRGSNVSGISFDDDQNISLWVFLRRYWKSSTLILLTFAGALRTTASMVFWHYRIQFWEERILSYYYVAIVVTVLGVFGALCGGILSDKASVKWGSEGRVAVIAMSVASSLPFQAMVLFLPQAPSVIAYCFESFFEIMHIPCATAVIVHIVRRHARVSTLGMWSAVGALTGGFAIIVLPFLDRAVPHKNNLYSLMLLYFFPTVLSAILYILCFFAEKGTRDERQLKKSRTFAERLVVPLNERLQSLSETEAFHPAFSVIDYTNVSCDEEISSVDEDELSHQRIQSL